MLGRRYELKNGQSVEVVDRCYDIPLLESLQRLLTISVVQEQVHIGYGWFHDGIISFFAGF